MVFYCFHSIGISILKLSLVVFLFYVITLLIRVIGPHPGAHQEAVMTNRACSESLRFHVMTGIFAHALF